MFLIYRFGSQHQETTDHFHTSPSVEIITCASSGAMPLSQTTSGNFELYFEPNTNQRVGQTSLEGVTKRIKRTCTSHSCEVLRLLTCHQVTYQMNRTDNEAAEVALTMLAIAREGVRVLTYKMNTGSLSCPWKTL